MRKHEIARITTMLLFVMLSTLTAFAQNITVKGVISDGQTNEPLMGVTVREKGNKTNGAVSDLDGNYSISVKSNATLVFSYMGFKDEEIAVQGRRSIAVTMHSESKVLDELVVIGYGVQRKSDITGSISSVAGKDINKTPVSSAVQALQGRATGVNIIQNTGAPGSSTTIKIRGTGTVNDSDPLYVVDGFIVDNIDYLNPNDIENVEIDKRTNEISLVRKTMTISNKKVHITQNIELNSYIDFWLWNYRKKGEKGKMVKDSTFEDYVQKADYIKRD